MAGLNGAEPVECSKKMVIVPDKSLKDALSSNYDAVVCPGGMGGAESMAAVSTGAGRIRKYGLCKYWCWEDQKVWPL